MSEVCMSLGANIKEFPTPLSVPYLINVDIGVFSAPVLMVFVYRVFLWEK